MSAKANQANFTQRQGEYLAFIYQYERLNGRPPAETDIARHFRVSPPSVHGMILTLAKRRLIERVAGKARSLRVLIEPSRLPLFPEGAEEKNAAPNPSTLTGNTVTVIGSFANRVLAKLFAHYEDQGLDDAEFAPLVRCLSEAVEEELTAASETTLTAQESQERVKEAAIERYTNLCMKNNPDADSEEDAEVFRYLMAHGQWPDK